MIVAPNHHPPPQARQQAAGYYLPDESWQTEDYDYIEQQVHSACRFVFVFWVIVMLDSLPLFYIFNSFTRIYVVSV